MKRVAVYLYFLTVTVIMIYPQFNGSVHFVADEEKRGGFLVDLVTAAYKRAGYTITIEYMPWLRALKEVTIGSKEGLLGIYYSDERAKTLVYSDELAESPMVFFVLRSAHITYTKLSDLRGYRIGCINGAVYPPAFAQADFFKKDPVVNFETNLNKLLYGRIQLFVEKKYSVLYYIKVNMPDQLDNIAVLDPPLTINKYFIALTRTLSGSEKKIADFNRGLALIKQDGTYQAIISKGQHE